jgi:hypothetical protein
LYYIFIIYKTNHHNTGGYFEWTWHENSCELPIPEPPTVPGQPPALAARAPAHRSPSLAQAAVFVACLPPAAPPPLE